MKSLAQKEIDCTHKNLYDNTLEGMRHKSLAISSVQFHPESILTTSGKDLLKNFLLM